jgi:hypothetical protein
VGVAIAAAGSSSLAAQADSGIVLGPRLSLATVIAQTIRHSPAWVSASGSVWNARAAERVAVGAYLPTVALNALAGRSDQSVTGNTTLPTAQPGAAQSAYGAGVSASLDLFTGGRWSAVRHETVALRRAPDAGLISQRFLTRLAAQEGCLEVLRGNELVRVADETTVTISRDYGSWVEVTGGVARGATIVLNPPDGLQAGHRVRAVPSTATSGG